MPSPLFLNDTVTLSNSLGEVNYKKAFQSTELSSVKVEALKGISYSGQGISPSDSSVLYIFKAQTIATPSRVYLEHGLWSKLSSEEKANYWTLAEEDTFTFGGRKFNIIGFQVFDTGSPFMHHIKVEAK